MVGFLGAIISTPSQAIWIVQKYVCLRSWSCWSSAAAAVFSQAQICLQVFILTNHFTGWLHLLLRPLVAASLSSCLSLSLPLHLSISLSSSPPLPYHTQSSETPTLPPLGGNFHYLSIKVNPSDGFVFADCSSANLVPAPFGWLYQLYFGLHLWFPHSWLWKTRQREFNGLSPFWSGVTCMMTSGSTTPGNI